MQITRLEITGLRAIRESWRSTSRPRTRSPVAAVSCSVRTGPARRRSFEAIAHVVQELGPEALGRRRFRTRPRRFGPSDVGTPPEGLDRGTTGAADTAPRAFIQLYASLATRTRDHPNVFPSISTRGVISVSVPTRKVVTSQYGEDAPFSQTARALLHDIKVAPAVLLTADRGGLDERDVFIEDMVRFDPREGCLAPGRDRFAPLAARLALATAAARFDRGGAVARMSKVLRKYFPELPRPVEHGTDLNLWFVTRGGIDGAAVEAQRRRARRPPYLR